jgi:ATP-dependent helicase/nuclease subunit A
VKILSIHRSKGLEYPVVFLCGLGRRFNQNDMMKPVLFHPKLGLGAKGLDRETNVEFSTLARTGVALALRREMMAEEMRLLYVAMTRAKEKLILVHSALNADKYLEKLVPLASSPVDPEVIEDRTCLGEWILLPLLTRPEAAPLKELAGCSTVAVGVPSAYPWKVFCHDGLSFEKRQAKGTAGESEIEAEPELPLDLMDFVYPYERETLLPTVVSPSQMKTAVQEGEESTLPPHIRGIRRPAFLEGAQTLTGAEAGTATHLLMQFLDFSCEGTEFAVRAEIARLQTARRISSAQADVIRVREVAALLQSDMGKRLRENVLHREYRLSLLMEARELDSAAAEGEQIMLHGVVDCWFEKPDGTVVVLDFKTDRVHGEKLQRRAEEYRPQVETYCKALERILGKKVSEKLLYFFSEGITVRL